MIHRVAFGVLVDGERVLLCHRHPARALFPDVWDLPGGHVEADETPADTLARELAEELGVRVTRSTPLHTTVDVPGAETHAFVITGWEGEPTNLAPDEHDDIRWATPAELAELDLAVPEVATLAAEAVAAVREQLDGVTARHAEKNALRER